MIEHLRVCAINFCMIEHLCRNIMSLIYVTFVWWAFTSLFYFKHEVIYLNFAVQQNSLKWLMCTGYSSPFSHPNTRPVCSFLLFFFSILNQTNEVKFIKSKQCEDLGLGKGGGVQEVRPFENSNFLKLPKTGIRTPIPTANRIIHGPLYPRK